MKSKDNIVASTQTRSRFAAALLAPVLVAGSYVFALAFTNSHYMADSGGYVVSILAYAGVSEYVAENPAVADYRSDNRFWDFGHLLWRPLGFLLYKVCNPVSSLVVGPEPEHNVRILLMWVNWLAGLVSALLVYAVTLKLTSRRWVAVVVGVCFIFSHAFLNFAQTASSYVTGLAFLIAGLYLLLKDKGEPSRLTAIFGGIACAGAVVTWAPYLYVVPGAIAAPFVLFGTRKREKMSLLYAGAAFLIATGVVYLVVMASIGMRHPSDFRDWLFASTHGIRTSGVVRMLFGLSRSFIHMGNDGVLFKRFMLNDPLNPVTAWDLMRSSIWKVLLFYIGFGAIMLSLIVSRSRRMLAFLSISALPFLLFAIKWDGAAIERYLPIYPAIFIVFGWVLSHERVPRVLKIVPLLSFGLAILINSSVMARVVLDRQRQTTEKRISELIPQLKPNSWLVTSHLQDALYNFQASFPFEPINRHNSYHVYPLLVINSDQVLRWREEFASRVLDAWGKGGDAWISMRLFSEKPEPSWNWVEGDDPHVRWEHLHKFFTQFETAATHGGTDGFVRLENSQKNKQILNFTVHKQ